MKAVVEGDGAARLEREAIASWLDRYAGKTHTFRARLTLAWRAVRYGQGQMEACGYSFAQRIRNNEYAQHVAAPPLTTPGAEG